MGSPPNILFILSDQQRWDTLGCYGQKLQLTPHLDQMAIEGVRFEHAFTPQPVCGPARACLMTGRYASQTGCFRNGLPLKPGETTIATLLSAAGYEAGYIGKWHLAGQIEFYGDRRKNNAIFDDAPVPPERRGGFNDYWLASDLLEFTSHGYDGHMFNANMQPVYFPAGRYRVDAQTDWVLDYLRARQNRPAKDRQKPFFLFVSYLEPHHQNDHNRYEAPHGSRQQWLDFETPGDLATKTGDWRTDYADYLACIHSLDENLGRIRFELEQLGLSNDTLVIYTSDHGNHCKTRNSEYKRSGHEASIRIPLVMVGPGFTGGKIISELVDLLDLPPTMLLNAGATPPDWMPGRPLQPLLAAEPPAWREEIYIQISEATLGRALRTTRWKYAIHDPWNDGWHKATSRHYVEDYLYDLSNDPHEQHNLVADPTFQSLRRDLQKRLVQHMQAAGEPIPKIVPAYSPLPSRLIITLARVKNSTWLYWKNFTQAK